MREQADERSTVVDQQAAKANEMDARAREAQAEADAKAAEAERLQATAARQQERVDESRSEVEEHRARADELDPHTTTEPADEGAERSPQQDADGTQPATEPATTEALEQLAGNEDLGRQAEQVHRQIDAGEEARLRVAIVHCRRNDVRLLEIDDGGAEGQQADPGADAEQIRRAESSGSAAKASRRRAAARCQQALAPLPARSPRARAGGRRTPRVPAAPRRRSAG